MNSWKRLLIYGVAGLLVSAAGWFALRAYTGIFEVLNLRVFVGAFMIVPALLGPLYGYGAKVMEPGAPKVPFEVSAAAGLFGVLSILGGEAAASLVKGVPIPWDKFNLLFMGVAAVLPFQINRVSKKG